MSNYSFGFTASSLRVNEFVNYAIQKKENQPLNLGFSKKATEKRMVNEFEKRINLLTDEELNLFTTSDFKTQLAITYLAVCKTYNFIFDFVNEVVRDNYLLYKYQISDMDMRNFVIDKMALHPELSAISEKTLYKIQQVTLKILEQAGIIDNVKNRSIQQPYISEDLIKIILHDHPDWLKIFLISDKDIEHYKKVFL